MAYRINADECIAWERVNRSALYHVFQNRLTENVRLMKRNVQAADLVLQSVPWNAFQK